MSAAMNWDTGEVYNFLMNDEGLYNLTQGRCERALKLGGIPRVVTALKAICAETGVIFTAKAKKSEMQWELLASAILDLE